MDTRDSSSIDIPHTDMLYIPLFAAFISIIPPVGSSRCLIQIPACSFHRIAMAECAPPMRCCFFPAEPKGRSRGTPQPAPILSSSPAARPDGLGPSRLLSPSPAAASPNTLQKRSVSSAAAEATTAPSGLCAEGERERGRGRGGGGEERGGSGRHQ